MRSFAQARARMKEFKLPDLGEGIHEGEVVRWLVNEGDPVKEEQLMVEVMTDKATVQIPSPWSGRVTKLLAKAGEVVKTGAGIILIEELGAPTAPAPAPVAPAPRYSPRRHRRDRRAPGERARGARRAEDGPGPGRGPHEGEGHGGLRADHGGGREERRQAGGGARACRPRGEAGPTRRAVPDDPPCPAKTRGGRRRSPSRAS